MTRDYDIWFTDVIVNAYNEDQCDHLWNVGKNRLQYYRHVATLVAPDIADLIYAIRENGDENDQGHKDLRNAAIGVGIRWLARPYAHSLERPLYSGDVICAHASGQAFMFTGGNDGSTRLREVGWDPVFEFKAIARERRQRAGI